MLNQVVYSFKQRGAEISIKRLETIRAFVWKLCQQQAQTQGHDKKKIGIWNIQWAKQDPQ